MSHGPSSSGVETQAAVLLPSLTGCVIKSKIINDTSYRKLMEIRQFAFHLVRMYWDLM